MTVFILSFLAGTGLLAQDLGNAVASASAAGPAWVAWEVPTFPERSICCWKEGSGCCTSCSLDNDRGISFNGDIGGSGRMAVVVRADRGSVQRVRLFDAGCGVTSRSETIHWVRDVDPARSLAWLASKVDAGGRNEIGGLLTAIAMHDHPDAMTRLERFALERDRVEKAREGALFWIGQTGGDRGFRFLRDFLRRDEPGGLRKRAVFSLSQSSSEQAIPELIALARNDKDRTVRREAIFWLGQKAGAKAAGELRRFVDEDPDDDIREHAVFAISQLPRERSIPLLTDLVRSHKSPKVRKKALFWLAQTGDDRALALIEEILIRR